MSDIAIVIPAWPFLTLAALLAMVAAGLAWGGTRSRGLLRWTAWVLAAILTLAAVLLATAALSIGWW